MNKFEKFKFLAKSVRYLEKRNIQINNQIEEIQNYLYGIHAVDLEKTRTTKPNGKDNASKIIKYSEVLEELESEKESNTNVIEYVEKVISTCKAPYNIYFAYKYYYGGILSELSEIIGTHRKNIYEGIKKEFNEIIDEKEMDSIIKECEYIKERLNNEQ